MGWYGDSNVECPHCRKKEASEIYRNSCEEGYYLICTACGLHLHCEYKQWVVTNSYIDKSIIGKDSEKDLVHPDELIDVERNEDIIPEGSSL